MTENVRLLKNTVIIMLGNFGTKLISFLLLPLYTSILSTEEYGTYDFILAIKEGIRLNTTTANTIKISSL